MRDVSFIVEDKDFSLSEKIEIVLVLMGEKLLGETKVHQSELLTDKPSEGDIRVIQLLQSHNVLHEFVSMKVIRKGIEVRHNWIQVFHSEEVQKWLGGRNQESLSPIELGVLYSYPPTAVQAFLGLLPKKSAENLPSLYYLAGVMSEPFYEAEKAFFNDQWERLRKVSTSLVEEAEKSVNYPIT